MTAWKHQELLFDAVDRDVVELVDWPRPQVAINLTLEDCAYLQIKIQDDKDMVAD